MPLSHAQSVNAASAANQPQITAMTAKTSNALKVISKKQQAHYTVRIFSCQVLLSGSGNF